MGDFQGHPFRGNQWSSGRAAFAGESRLKALGKERVRALEAVMDRADESLPSEAQEAVSRFVGHGPGARKAVFAGDDMAAFGVMSEARLEDAMSANPSPEGMLVRDQLRAAFEPVREALRAEFGDSVTVFRVQGEVGEGSKPRNVVSTTLNPEFARDYTGAYRDLKEFSPAEVDQMSSEAERTGVLKVKKGLELRREPFVWGGKVQGNSWNIYENGEMITDTDSPRWFLESENRDAREQNARNSKQLERVHRAEVSLEDVVWATQRANQWELIVRTDASSWAPPRKIEPERRDIRRPGSY
jgi:hypothetical protein